MTAAPGPSRPPERAIRLRLFAAALAVAGGVAALVVAILLVRSVLGS